jgi:Fe-S cluster assembly protein SufD
MTVTPSALADSTSEAWRYSSFDASELAKFGGVSQVTPISLDDALPEWAKLFGSIGGSVTASGIWLGGADQTGVSVSTGHADIAGWGTDELAGEGWNQWRQSVADGASVDTALTIKVAERAQVAEPLVLVHPSVDRGASASRQIRVDIAPNARVTIVELHTSPTPSVYAPTTTVTVGAGAHVELITIQVGGAEYVHLAQIVAALSTGSVFRATIASLGGAVGRNEIAVTTNGEHGEALLRAVYFGAGDQIHDFRTLQAHPKPKSTSDLVFKGAVADRAHGIYSGMIRIDRGASGTKAYQTNRNLILSPTASADSVPNLEIDENDVACSHASAVGPLDADQVFYLESRGVPTDIATQLIVEGFFTSVVEGSAIAGLGDVLRSAVASRLANVEIEPQIVLEAN